MRKLLVMLNAIVKSGEPWCAATPMAASARALSGASADLQGLSALAAG
jgi:hypothetical protein